MAKIEPDDIEAPAPSTLAVAQPSGFWSTVDWRLGLGVIVVALTTLAIFILSIFNARHPLDIPILTGGSALCMTILWVVSRVLWAWVEWPSEYRAVRCLKCVIRYFCFDSAAERRDSPATPLE
jgi:hypothetical protein